MNKESEFDYCEKDDDETERSPYFTERPKNDYSERFQPLAEAKTSRYHRK